MKQITTETISPPETNLALVTPMSPLVSLLTSNPKFQFPSGSASIAICKSNEPSAVLPEQLPEAAGCKECYGAGYVVIGGRGARPCQCRRRKLRERVVAAIPLKFKRRGLPVLAELEPHRAAHGAPEIARYIFAKQRDLIFFAKNNPFVNFLLMGDNGVGKSHLGYALYLNAFDSGRRVYAGTLSELLSEYRRFERNEAADNGQRFYPQITAADLRQTNGERWTILLDEFDKPRVTAFTAEMVFELLNAAQNFGHQVIALSNLNERELLDAWSLADGATGRSIIKRLSENAAGESIFHREAFSNYALTA